MKRQVKRDFVLDLTAPDNLKVIDEIRRREELKEFFRTDDGHIAWSLYRKKKGTCFQEPIIPWNEVKSGDRLWAEYRQGISLKFHPILVTKIYGGVVFFYWLDGPQKNKMEHADLSSVFCDSMVYPYIIRIPEDVRITDCHNPKQIYEYVEKR
jgi:hypothetical protein